jgi:hypothetical protein
MKRECPVCGLTWTCVCELAGAPARPTTCPKHGALLGEAGCWDCRNADPAQPEHDAEVEAIVREALPDWRSNDATKVVETVREAVRHAVQAGRELGRAEKVEALRDDAWEAGRKEGARAAKAAHLCPMDIGPALDQSLAEAMETGAREEREACARLVMEGYEEFDPDDAWKPSTAAAIRARGEPTPRDGGEEGE